MNTTVQEREVRTIIMADFDDVSNILVPHRRKVHVVIFLMTILMIPGALKALEPIDMESYDMESPELTAERIINCLLYTSDAADDL